MSTSPVSERIKPPRPRNEEFPLSRCVPTCHLPDLPVWRTHPARRTRPGQDSGRRGRLGRALPVVLWPNAGSPRPMEGDAEVYRLGGTCSGDGMDPPDASLRCAPGTHAGGGAPRRGDGLVGSGPRRPPGPRHSVEADGAGQGRPLRLDGQAARAGHPGRRSLPAVVSLALRRLVEFDARSPAGEPAREAGSPSVR